MANNVHDITTNTTTASSCSSSSLSTPPPSEPDDLSIFLHQMLLRHSSSSPISTTSLIYNPPTPISSSSSAAAVFSSSDAYFPLPVNPTNVSSSSAGTSDINELDEFECESEDGLEALVEEGLAKPPPQRNSSKRSRAAEVHNLSEKRRRSRINEKMKALQNLIPNSNKTDKASMLDEAIEYLKQLQLQVQMLTMRNGLSLYPCLQEVLPPGQLSLMRMEFCEGSGSLNTNVTGSPHGHLGTRANALFSMYDDYSHRGQSSVTNLPNPSTSLAMESSFQAHFGPFQLHKSSNEICTEDLLAGQQLSMDHSDANLLDFQMRAKAAPTIPFDTETSEFENAALEASNLRRDQMERMNQADLDSDSILLPHFNGMDAPRSKSDHNNIKTEQLDF